MEIINDWKINLLIAFILGMTVYYILQINGPAQINVLSYGDNVLLNYLAGIVGSLMIFLIAKISTEIWHEREWIKTISRNTLFIIFFHWFVLTIWGMLISKIIIIMDIKVSFAFIMCVSFMITLVILWISKVIYDHGVKRLPLVFGKK